VMNTLIPEQLGMSTRLQPLFKEKMGELQEGDYVIYASFFNCIKIYGVVLKNDGKDTTIHYFDKDYEIKKQSNKDLFHHLIRIPKPIDWQNPERGLWGMVDWEKWNIENTRSDDGSVLVFQKMSIGGKQVITDPFTALLKALCEQEGV